MSERETSPVEKFERGAVDEISNKLPYFLQLNYGRDNTDEMLRLRDAMANSFTHVLRLPRVNVSAMVKKYGPYFDKSKAYHDFIKELSIEIVGYEPRHPSDSYYLFKSRSDAEKIAKVISFRQENTDFPISK